MSDSPLQFRGMEFYEREAVKRAREWWLPVLENMLAGSDNPHEQEWFAVEIKRLRRLLGVRLSDEERRAGTRDRVRQHRRRKREGVVLRPLREPEAFESIAADLKSSVEFYRGMTRRRG